MPIPHAHLRRGPHDNPLHDSGGSVNLKETRNSIIYHEESFSCQTSERFLSMIPASRAADGMLLMPEPSIIGNVNAIIA